MTQPGPVEVPPRPRREPVALAVAGFLALLPAAWLAVSTFAYGQPLDVGFEAAFAPWAAYLVPWVLGAATFVAGLGLGRPTHRALGVGFMTVPVWETVWGILDSIVELQQGGFTFRAFTHHELSSLYLYKLVEDLGYLAFGFLLYTGRPWSPRDVARALARAGLPMGRRTEARSALLGLVAFPVLLLSTVLVNLWLNRVDGLNQSNEGSIYDNMTLFHAVMISLAAAFTEELVYRGVILVGLSRAMPMWLAVLLQAAVFGFAHGGYGTWSHVIIAGLFGLVSGVVAWRLGLWAALVLHFLVDLVAFGADASNHVPWLWQAIVWAFLANCGLTVAYAALWVVRRVETGRTPPTA